MSIAPMPAPPRYRFVPAEESVRERTGVTVSIDRQPNLCRWAIHTLTPSGKPHVVFGPRAGQNSNPSNTQLAAQIVEAIATTGVDVQSVFAAEWPTSELLRSKTALPLVALAPPPDALTAVREAILNVESRMVKNLTLACDSSRGYGKNVNGCGWVLSYSTSAEAVVGTYTTVSDRGGIRAGELAAIRRGLQSTLNLHPVLTKGIGNLQVLSDSKSALDLLSRVGAGGDLRGEDTDSLNECRRILGSAEGIDIRFDWVRGHDGHPLNEIADRLAMLARRNRELEVDEVTHARMVAGVRVDARVICATLVK